ncbi:MAG: ankyrin repeat domain-containing protein [Thermodesulfobacteriota bacterium]
MNTLQTILKKKMSALAAVIIVVSLPVLGSAKTVLNLQDMQPYKSSPEEELRSAAHSGDVAEIKRLIARGAKVNWADDEGWTALFWASVAVQPEAVKTLLDRGADVNARDRAGWSSLFWAAMNGHSTIVEMLADRGADVSVADHKGRTALMEAAAKGKIGAVEVLVARGANLDAKDGHGETALSLAAADQRLAVAELLMAKGAQADTRTTELLKKAQTERSNQAQAAAPKTQTLASLSSAKEDVVVERPKRELPAEQTVSAARRTLKAETPVQSPEGKLLKHALALWNQIRTENPELAKKLTQDLLVKALRN